MQSDPRIGLAVSLGVVLAAIGWFLAVWSAGDALFAQLRYTMHAITFFSIFLTFAGAAAAGVFLRFHRVRRDLLEGRDVLARWHVSEEALRVHAPKALAADARDKRAALLTVCVFIVVIFGAFALYDPEVAPQMLMFALGVAAAMVVAYLAGRKIEARHLVYTTGDAIVGSRGLMFNGVLHVWAAPLSWLSDARLSRDGARFEVTYAHLSKMGPQYVSVAVPVPAEAKIQAQRAADALRLRAGRVPAARA